MPLSAKDARVKSAHIVEADAFNHLRSFFDWVEIQCEHGQFSGWWWSDTFLSKRELSYLRSLGYTITQVNLQSQYQVSWE